MNASILDTIVARKRMEVAAKRAAGAYTNLPVAGPTRNFKAALLSGSGIIAEFKRRSPSKGEIHAAADPGEIVAGYANAGASCASVLTDTPFFGGALSDLVIARKAAPELPILRKEFIVAPEQIVEAAAFGADAVLLIAAVLSKGEISEYTALAHNLGLQVLLEIHAEAELDKICHEADMLGVNNRNLSTFHTDIGQSRLLLEKLPAKAIKVAESGITDASQMKLLRNSGYSGFLIGEVFMRATNPAKALRDFLNPNNSEI